MQMHTHGPEASTQIYKSDKIRDCEIYSEIIHVGGHVTLGCVACHLLYNVGFGSSACSKEKVERFS